MAVEKTYTGDGGTDVFEITFPFIDTTDVKVSVEGVTKSTPADYTILDDLVTLTTTPGNGDAVRLYRNTKIDTPKVTFTAGSSVKAGDLNTAVKQLLYAIEEVGTVTANDEGLGLVSGSKGDIHVNTATDWYIKNSSVTNSMLDSLSIDGTKIAGDAIDGTKIADNAIDSEHYTDLSIDTIHLSDDSVNADKIADATISESKLSAAAKSSFLNPVGTVIWFAGSTAPSGYLKCNGDSIPSGSGTVQGISSDFSALHDVVGSTLPDLRGEFIRGWDDGRGIDSGRSNRTTQSAQNESHNHSVSISSNGDSHYHIMPGDDMLSNGNGSAGWTSTHEGTIGYDAISNSNSGGKMWRTSTTSTAHTHSVGETTQGGSEARPRNVALLACIKY